jgi:hypothetical protein
LREAVGKEFDAVINALLTAAKAGDTQAAALLLARVVPAARPVQEPFPVRLGGRTLSDKAAAIFEAVSAGELAPSDAKLLLDGLAGVAKIAEFDDLKARLEILEATLKQRGNGR